MTTTEHEMDEHGLVKATPDAIFTFSGGTIRPLDPDPADIHIEDIAHSLANQCRWTGHVSKFFSVAEHSMVVAMLVPPPLRLSALLHDATEAYLADLARPIKHAPVLGETYLKYEEQLEQAIKARFGVLTPHESDDIKWADDQVLRAEAHQLLPESLRKVMPVPEGRIGYLHCYPPPEAKRWFLASFRMFGGQS